MEIRKKLEHAFKETCASRNTTAPEVLGDEMVLLQSGLDSLGFAILVTNLEMELGYDPFTLMAEPVYPHTFGEFVAIYDRFKSHATS